MQPAEYTWLKSSLETHLFLKRRWQESHTGHLCTCRAEDVYVMKSNIAERLHKKKWRIHDELAPHGWDWGVRCSHWKEGDVFFCIKLKKKLHKLRFKPVQFCPKISALLERTDNSPRCASAFVILKLKPLVVSLLQAEEHRTANLPREVCRPCWPSFLDVM